jgi:uncharacterized protein (TIGR03435 family)
MKVSALLLTLIGSLSAQTFDVVSVKEITDPATLQSIKSADIKYSPGNLYMRGTTLAYAIEWAFDIQRYQIDGPEWMYWRSSNDQPRFVIFAKTDPGTTKAQARVMAQAALAERFGLKVHWEDRQKPGYMLRDDPKGLKVEFIEPTDEMPGMTFDKATGKLQYKNMNVAEMCGDIALTVGEPVVDGTTLGKRMYNATSIIHYEPGAGELLGALFGAMKRDMGIVASREKVPVKTLVVDQVNRKPSAN